MVDWISFTTIKQIIGAFDSKHVLVIFDTSYAGHFTRSKISEATNYKTMYLPLGDSDISMSPEELFLRKMLARKSRMIMTSGDLEPVLDGGSPDKMNSIFAHYLVKALEETEGNVVPFSSIFNKVQRGVVVDADQIPQFSPIFESGHEGSIFVLVKKQ